MPLCNGSRNRPLILAIFFAISRLLGSTKNSTSAAQLSLLSQGESLDAQDSERVFCFYAKNTRI